MYLRGLNLPIAIVKSNAPVQDPSALVNEGGSLELLHR